MNVHENVHVARGMGSWFASLWFALLVTAGCLLSMVLVLIVGGSLAAQWVGASSRPLMFLAGCLLCLTPAVILNGFVTWLRQQFNRRAGFFDTFFTLFLVGNTALLAGFVLWMPGQTSQALYRYGNWMFDRDVANLLHISEQHPVLRTGRKLVQRVAYLLEVEPSGNRAASAPSTSHRLPRQRPPYPRIHALGPQSAADSPRARPPQPRDMTLPRQPRVAPRRPLPPRQTARPAPRHTPLPALKRPDEITIRVRRHGNSLVIPLGLPGRQRDFLLDTGASFLSLSTQMARRLGVLPSRQAPTLSLHTANGIIKARVGILPYLQLGNYKLHNVTFVLCDACGEPQQGVVGLLGLNVLRRFLVTIDQANGSIHLRPQQAHRFRNQAADLRPFLQWPKQHLKGYTTNIFVRRVFQLKGLLRNRANRGASHLRFRITYLRRKRKVGHHDFTVGELEANGSLRVTIRDKQAPRFESYRVELIQGVWDQP